MVLGECATTSTDRRTDRFNDDRVQDIHSIQGRNERALHYRSMSSTSQVTTVQRIERPEPTLSSDRIRQVAVALFERNGYDATGMRELSEAAGLGLGALYHHIGSKEQLLFDLSVRLLRLALDEATDEISRQHDPEGQLRALARHLVKQHATRRAEWAVALRETRALSEPHRSEVLAARDAYEQLWSTVLEQGAVAGRWRPVTSVELYGVLGMFNSTARWIDPAGPDAPEAVADRYVDLLMTGLR